MSAYGHKLLAEGGTSTESATGAGGCEPFPRLFQRIERIVGRMFDVKLACCL
jgi:hypothetical protein